MHIGDHVCNEECKKWHGGHKWKKYHHHSLGGGLWIMGWLFTIGFLKLTFWWGVLAVIIWPYLIGAHFAA